MPNPSKLAQIVLFGDSLTEWSFDEMGEPIQQPQLVLFGASMTEWSFDKERGGFGWVMQQKYGGKAVIVNEGQAGYTSSMLKRNFEEIIRRATRPGAAPTPLITIFVGANDACFVGNNENYVPLPKFEENIRLFIESVLIEDNLPDTKVVVITPPPINIPDPLPDPLQHMARFGEVPGDPKQTRSYRTYMSKKRYAEKIMEIAKDYEETERVIGLNIWRALVDKALEEQGRASDENKYDEDRLPGCGLEGAREFRKGYFTDGLHFDNLGYDVVSKELLESVWTRWPELLPEKIAESF